MEVARRPRRSLGEVPKILGKPTFFQVYASKPIQTKDQSWETRYTLFMRGAVTAFAAPRNSQRKGEEIWEKLVRQHLRKT